MGALEDLKHIEAEMLSILQRFSHSRDHITIADGDQAIFIGLCLEAEDLINSVSGPVNSFSHAIRATSTQGRLNYIGSQSYASVEETIGILQAAIRKVARANSPSSPTPNRNVLAPDYVGGQRLSELRLLPNHKFDFRRLVRMCEEINESFATGNYIATAALLRAVKDHVPPALGASSFAEYVAAQNGRSHKGSMEHLATSLKHIADQWLHGHIRSRESLPTAQQVDFRQDLDVLLSEIVRLHRT